MNDIKEVECNQIAKCSWCRVQVESTDVRSRADLPLGPYPDSSLSCNFLFPLLKMESNASWGCCEN